MNWDQAKGKWDELTGQAKEQWGELTEDEITEAAGQREQLAAKIQQRYGKSKEDAEHAVDEWIAKIN